MWTEVLREWIDLTCHEVSWVLNTFLLKIYLCGLSGFQGAAEVRSLNGYKGQSWGLCKPGACTRSPSPTWWQGPKLLGCFCWFPRWISKKQDLKWSSQDSYWLSDRGCWGYRWQVNLLYMATLIHKNVFYGTLKTICTVKMRGFWETMHVDIKLKKIIWKVEL